MKLQRLDYKNYLSVVNALPGVGLFRNLFVVDEDGREFDAAGDGDLSCALVVSSVLLLFGWIDRAHATVESTIRAMEVFGWRETDQPRAGDIVYYVAGKTDNAHLGFFVDGMHFLKHHFGSFELVNLLALDKVKIRERLNACDAIFCFGGSSDYLMSVLNKTGVSEMLPELLRARVWCGSSAGSMVIGHRPSDKLADDLWGGTRLEEKDDYGVKKYLELVPACVIPHLCGGNLTCDPRDGTVIGNSATMDVPVYALSDWSAVVVDGGDVKVIGKLWSKLDRGKVVERNTEEVDEDMQQRIVEFAEQFGPLSVFLYGSQATGETTSRSDWEVGLVFEDDKYVSRREIKAKQDFEGVSIYPFRLSELKDYSLDTPFPKKIFVYQLIKSGKTIFGDDIISRIEVPEIKQVDLVGAIRFYIGVAFCSFLTMRRGDVFLTNDEFSKSCLFGLRILALAREGELLVGYSDIYYYGLKLELPDGFREVVEAAYGVRRGDDEVDPNLIYKNMSFLNYIESEVLKIGSNGQK
jgi:dipeptidase E